MNRATSWFSIVSVAVAAGCNIDDPDSLSMTSETLEPGLIFESETPTDVKGSYVGEAGRIRFSSHADWGATVTATMRVGESRIDIAYDAGEGEAGEMSLAIAGDLSAGERSLLIDFGTALERRFYYERDPDQPTGALLRTYASFLGAWTLGPTPRPIVTRIAARAKDPPDPQSPDDDPGVPGKPKPAHPPRYVCLDVGDNDGVTFLAKCCNGGAVVAWQHDALDHCFTTMTNMCGEGSALSLDPLATMCPGRCGSGCSALPFYTQDCLDHDLCLMHHGGLGSLDPTGSCGDEILEALDDFAYVYGNGIGWVHWWISGCFY